MIEDYNEFLKDNLNSLKKQFADEKYEEFLDFCKRKYDQLKKEV